jgi:hypothetical protein
VLQPTSPIGHGRRGFAVLGVVAWLAALVVIIGVAVGGHDPITTSPATPPPSLVAEATPSASEPPRDPIAEPNARITMVHGPMGVTVGFGSVWVVTSADLRLRRLDPGASDTVVGIDLPFVSPSPSSTPLPTASGETALATVGGGMSPAGHDLLPLVAVGAGTVWVLGAPSAEVLVGVDPASGDVLGAIRLPAPGTGIVSGPGGTWVTTDAGLLIGIDVSRGALGPILRLGGGRVAAAAGTNATWVSLSDGRILRLDRRGRITATNAGGGGPIAVEDGSVWVRSGQTLIQIDERSGRSIARTDVATSGGQSIAWALPSIVAVDYGDTIARVAPTEAWMVTTHKTVWLCRPDRGELWEMDVPN